MILLVAAGLASPQACGACHEREYAAWYGSRHRQSWTNDLMRAGFIAESEPFCADCHAPSGKEEVLANLDWYRSLDPRSGIRAGSVARLPEPRAALGVHCEVCHVRDGGIVASVRSGLAAHEVVEDPGLSSSAFCVDCHDFTFPGTGQPMQSTGAEWRAWGGTETCQDCHMPGGSHAVRGAHDRGWLAASVRIEVGGGVARIWTVGVGHAFPTGDLFRHLTLEVDGVVVHRIGKTYRMQDGVNALVDDNRLLPGEVRTVEVPAGPWRLVWHDASERDEVRGLLDPAAITAVLASGPG